MLEEDVDFGATDRPLLDSERARARCGPVEIPTVVGAIAVVVNLPRITNAVRLDADALAGIYLGRIVRWDDRALRDLNPSLALPATPILAVHRVRTSGTGDVFADYLSTSSAWRVARSVSITSRTL